MIEIRTHGQSAYEHLRNLVLNFEKLLPSEHAVGVVPTSSSDGATIKLEQLIRMGEVIVFAGEDNDGNLCELVQHSGALNFQLVAIPINVIGKPIGFIIQELRIAP